MAATTAISKIGDVPLGEPVRVDVGLLQLDADNPRLIIAAELHNDDAIIRELHDEGDRSFASLVSVLCHSQRCR
jgi:hypothetical protein